MKFVIWRFVKIAKLKTRQFKLHAYVPMMLSIQIAKFKFHQYQLRAISPNLVLTKVTHHTVYSYQGTSKWQSLIKAHSHTTWQLVPCVHVQENTTFVHSIWTKNHQI